MESPLSWRRDGGGGFQGGLYWTWAELRYGREGRVQGVRAECGRGTCKRRFDNVSLAEGGRGEMMRTLQRA